MGLFVGIDKLSLSPDPFILYLLYLAFILTPLSFILLYLYLKLKEILAYERANGTLPTAIRYSATWGNPDYKISSAKGGLGGNAGIESSVGTIDLDWYLDLGSFGYGIQAPILYPVAKTGWNAIRNLLLGQNIPYSNMYEPKEKRAINALLTGKSLNELFGDTCNKTCN